MKKRILILIFLMGFGHAGFAEEPEEKPLWEFGMFNGAARFPHYRGSDEHKVYVLPLPYLIYRGEFVRANREGLNGIFWKNDRVETALSFGGSPPVDEDNKARQGMPKIGAIVEVGPGIKVFIRDRGSENPLYLKAGVRATISVDTDDFGIAYRGVRGNVKLIYRNYTWLKDRDIKLGLNAGVDFADRDYHATFYDVSPEHVLPNRPAYNAEGGYSGFSLSANAVKKINDRWSVGAYYRWDNQSGAAYADSPLVKIDNNHILGIALIWKITESKKVSLYQSE